MSTIARIPTVQGDFSNFYFTSVAVNRKGDEVGEGHQSNLSDRIVPRNLNWQGYCQRWNSIDSNDVNFC